MWWFCWQYEWCHHADNRHVCDFRPQRLGYLPSISHICLKSQPFWNHTWHSLFPNLWLRTSETTVDYYWEQLIQQIRKARQLTAECIQQAQQHMKIYYIQHGKDNFFRVGHKVWIYNPTVKQGLSKNLCFLCMARFAWSTKSRQYPLRLPLFRESYRKVQYT